MNDEDDKDDDYGLEVERIQFLNRWRTRKDWRWDGLIDKILIKPPDPPKKPIKNEKKILDQRR